MAKQWTVVLGVALLTLAAAAQDTSALKTPKETKALASDDDGDKTYKRLEDGIADLTSQRNKLAHKMIKLLRSAEFGGLGIDGHQADELVEQAERLLDRIHDLNHGDDDRDRH